MNIKYPQDAQLLNAARVNLEADIKTMAKQLHQAPPRTYKREARKCWTAYSRRPRLRQTKATRDQIKAQLQYIRRDLRYIDTLLAQGGQLTKRQTECLATIRKVYKQQDYMYRQHTHKVPDRIVSLSQPNIRLIVRGKAKAPVEFGPKVDFSIVDGVINIERYAYSAFNEDADLQATLTKFKEQHGEYPDEALADVLYRTAANRKWCEQRNIKLSGPKRGRKPKHMDLQKKREDQDAENRRGAIERQFAFIKAKLGMNRVTAKTAEKVAVAVDTAVVMANLTNFLVLCGPISLMTKKEAKLFQINYKVIEDRAILAP